MKILVDIPIEAYNNFVQRCDASRPEYEILKNGMIIRARNEAGVEILCAIEDAQSLLDLANDIYPQAAPHVERSISLARQPVGARPATTRGDTDRLNKHDTR